MRKKILILGSTGSIGTAALEVAEALRDTVQVVGLAAGVHHGELAEQAVRFNVPAVSIADPSAETTLRRACRRGTEVFAGPQGAVELVEQSDADFALAAIVGAAGLPPTLAAVGRGIDVGLANKESLVIAGTLLMPLARRNGSQLIPVDSEHSAVFQALRCGKLDEVRRIILTASGGPFRTWPAERIEHATIDEALAHPTWAMGPKITIDSATMMNKALEIIEAHWLFGLPPEKIDVIIHPQSIVHSFVEFEDHSVLAQLGPPDMRTPIQYALTYPHRTGGCSDAMDWTTLRQLEFEPPDHGRFRSLKLAYDVIRAGGTAGAVFNAANESAVAAFLARRITFGRIAELAAEALSALDIRRVDSLDTVLEADREARRFVHRAVGAQSHTVT